MNSSVKLLVVAICLSASSLWATPSRYVWAPNVETQQASTLRFDMEQRLATNKDTDKVPAASSASSLGFNYGVGQWDNVSLELGFDWQEPSGDELQHVAQLNTKLAFSSVFYKNLDFAIGMQNFGFDSDVSAYNILYGLSEMDLLEMGKFSFGIYSGNSDLLVDSNGKKDNTGVIVAWNTNIQSGKGKFSAEFISGKNSFSGLHLGVDLLVQQGLRTTLAYQVASDSDYRNFILAKLSFDY